MVKQTRGNSGHVQASYIIPTLTLSKIPPGSSWGNWRTLEKTTSMYPNTRDEYYEVGVWAEPRSMINFPLTVQLRYSYKSYYRECTWFFKWWCDDESTSGSSTTDITTIHFDVLPEDIIAFETWTELTSLDSDGDGVRNTDELTHNTNPWKVDTDGDSLWDKYEIDEGLLPYSPDTDNDGIEDGLEFQLRTDPHHNDTDNDGLTDYEEYRGWKINLSYFGTTFTMEVSSDPLVKDTDNDTVLDLEEFMKHLNPRSRDTDGDGIDDANESSYPCFGLIERVDYNGVGSSIRVVPGVNITTTVQYRIMGVNNSITGQSESCSLVATIENTNFTTIIIHAFY
jgi:hypothetical protein